MLSGKLEVLAINLADDIDLIVSDLADELGRVTGPELTVFNERAWSDNGTWSDDNAVTNDRTSTDDSTRTNLGLVTNIGGDDDSTVTDDAIRSNINDGWEASLKLRDSGDRGAVLDGGVVGDVDSILVTTDSNTWPDLREREVREWSTR